METNQKYDLKSIQVEPDLMVDVLKMSKGLVRLHFAYNEQFKGMNSEMNFIEEVLSGQKMGTVSTKKTYDLNTLHKIRTIWNGPLYFENTRDEMKPNRIIKYEVVYHEEHLDPMKESFELPALQEIDPLSHVNDIGQFIEMTEYIPVRLAWWKLSINQINTQWYQPRYFSWDQIRSLPLSRTTNFWGKPYFFSLIKQLRILWKKYYFELSATDHEIIRETKLMGSEDKQYQIKTL